MLLCIASLTLALCAGAAWFRAGSANGAFAFGLAAFTLLPPAQQLIGNLTHRLLPARLAFIATLTLVPLGAMFVAIDGVAILDAAAKQRGFTSAGQMARARDLGLATPAALVAYDEARHRSARDKQCRAEAAKPSLACLEPGHRRAAQAFAESLLDERGYEQAVRESLAQQRTQFLAADRNCAGLIERIEAEALPQILRNRVAGVQLSAALWARALSQSQLEMLTKASRPGVSHVRTPATENLEKTVASMADRLDREYDAALQAWARRLVGEDASWRMLFGGRSAIEDCKPAMATTAH